MTFRMDRSSSGSWKVMQASLGSLKQAGITSQRPEHWAIRSSLLTDDWVTAWALSSSSPGCGHADPGSLKALYFAYLQKWDRWMSPRTTLPLGWQRHGVGLPASRPASWLASLRGASAGTPPLPEWPEAPPPPLSSPIVLAARQGAGRGVASHGTLQGTSSSGSPPTLDRLLDPAAPPTLQVAAPDPLNRGHPPPPHVFPSPGLVVHQFKYQL